MFGERFECASGFPHTGSGRPEVGVGEWCAGAATHPPHVGLEVERWKRWLCTAGIGQGLPAFDKSKGKT